MRRLPPVAWLGILLAATGIAAVGLAIRSHAPKPLNVLLITLDTTRADRLGPYGFQASHTPHLDRLAREGALFEQTWAVAPLTLPAHTSILTGQFPPVHGVRDNAGFTLGTQQPVLAEILQRRGFRTGAFVGSYVLRAETGLTRGFERYDDNFASGARAHGKRALRRPADQVVDRGLAWLQEVASDRFFGWIHFYDAHAPYGAPAAYQSKYTDPYIAALAFIDAQIGRILASLDQRGVLDRTVVIVIGDHGESLGEHGERTHRLFVYESVLRVPFIIRVPGEHMRRAIPGLVRGVDVLPTVLDLIGEPPLGNIDGVSLVPLMTGTSADLGLEGYAESMYPFRHFGWSDLRALRAGRFKLIAAPRPELYDLWVDPHEQVNLYDQDPATARQLAGRLRAMEQRFARAAAPLREEAIDSDTRQRLGALGYVSRTHVEASTDRLADPKDKIDFFNEMIGSRELYDPDGFWTAHDTAVGKAAPSGWEKQR